MAHRERNAFFVWLNRVSIIAFCQLMAKLPLSWCRAVGRTVGWLAYYFVPKIQRVGLGNLDLAYGDTLTLEEKRGILRRAAQSVGTTAAEFCRIRCTRDEAFLHDQVRIEGAEHVDPARGVLLIGAHFGNWEWMAPSVRSFRPLVAEVVQGVLDPKLNAWVDANRRMGDLVTIHKDGCGPELIRLLREGWLVGVLIDQNPRDNGVPVEFFGTQCWGTIAPALLAARAKVPVHTIAMIRGADGRYTLRLSPPVELVDTGELANDIVENCQRAQRAIEAMIRENPDHWLWFHRRWKARPRLEEEWAARQARRRRTAETPSSTR